MDMIGLLVALHPKDWRERYGEEFAALLEDTPLTPSAVANVAAHSVALHVRARLETVLVAAAVLASVTCIVIAHETGLAANIWWVPADPLRALALLGTVGPWAVVLVRGGARRRAARRA